MEPLDVGEHTLTLLAATMPAAAISWPSPWTLNGWSSCRDGWLNPPEWVQWVIEPVPGYSKRPVTALSRSAVYALMAEPEPGGHLRGQR